MTCFHENFYESLDQFGTSFTILILLFVYAYFFNNNLIGYIICEHVGSVHSFFVKTYANQVNGYDVLMVVGGMYVEQSVGYTVNAVEVIGLTSVCQVHTKSFCKYSAVELGDKEPSNLDSLISK